MSTKLLVVIGATGNQGGSVIASILSDPEAKAQFSIRGVTRDISKPAAKKLIDQGVEMVVGDLGDKESLVKAFKGAYAVFGVTDYWAVMSKEKEVQQGKDIVDAAKAAGVQHFIFSSLLNTTESTKGKLSNIHHFDSKAEIAAYASTQGLPLSEYLPGFYMSNLPSSSIKKDPSTGLYTLYLPCDPDALIPLIDICADTGIYVKAILLNRDQALGRKVYGSAGYLTPEEIMKQFAETFPVDGKGAKFQQVPGGAYQDQLKGYGMPAFAAEELYENMLLLNKEYGYYGGADLTTPAIQLKEKPTSWIEYIKRNPAYKDLK